MSDSETSGGSTFNPFAVPSNSYQRGWVLDLRQVFDGMLRPKMESLGRQEKTIKGIDRHLRTFEEWWEMLRAQWEGRKDEMIFDRPVVAGIGRETLLAFQQHVIKTGKSNKHANSAMRAVRQVLRCAESHQLIPQTPQVTDLPVQKSCPTVYLTDEQIVALWNAADHLEWPQKRRGFRPLHYPAPMAWRCCLVLWVIYGFRTQDLIALESKSTPLTWGNFSDVMDTPNPAGHATNHLGWLHFTPTKSKRFDRPLYLPLNAYARSAIERLRPSDWTPDMPICDWTFSSTSFYSTWHKWVELAGIKPKAGKKITAMHLRKTCVTRIERHRIGLSVYIVGHTPDVLSMPQVSRSKVSELHYNNPEEQILECISSISLPSCFKSILLPVSLGR